MLSKVKKDFYAFLRNNLLAEIFLLKNTVTINMQKMYSIVQYSTRVVWLVCSVRLYVGLACGL